MSKKGPDNVPMVQLTTQHAPDLKTTRVLTCLGNPTRAMQKFLNALKRMCLGRRQPYPASKPTQNTAASSAVISYLWGRAERMQQCKCGCT
eukprot:4752711-Pyramimonas_sp.AAC.1